MGKVLPFERVKREKNSEPSLQERINIIKQSLDRIQAIMQEMRREHEHSNISTHSKREPD